MSTIKYLSRLGSLVVLIGILYSCGEDHPLTEKTYYFDDENRGWVCPDSLDEIFMMVDENSISQQFILNRTNSEFDKSWGGFLGLNMETVHTETSDYAYRTNYGTGGFRVGLRAGTHPDHGDRLTLHIDQLTFSFDLSHMWLTKMGTSFSDRSDEYLYRDSEDSGPILSSCEILENEEFNGIVYEEILHFVRKDFLNYTNSFTIVEFYLSKAKGLIWYKMKDGLETFRTLKN